MLKRLLFLIVALSIWSNFSFAETKKTIFIPDNTNELIAQNTDNDFENMEKDIEKQFPQPEFRGAFVKMLFSLMIVVGLAFLTFYMFRRLSKTRIIAANSNKAIKVLEKRILSPKSILYLIEYEGKKALVSESHLDVEIQFLEK